MAEAFFSGNSDEYPSDEELNLDGGDDDEEGGAEYEEPGWSLLSPG